MSDRFLTIQQAAKVLGVTKDSLRNWDKSSYLVPSRTPGGHRRYLESHVNEKLGIRESQETTKVSNRAAVYVRVSSSEQKQKGDLDRQKGRVLDYCVKNNLSVAKVLGEVGSGMSDTRPKIKRLFALVENEEVDTVVVEHKDRLTRFNFAVYEAFFKSYGVSIVVMKSVLAKTYEAELVEDMLSLMASFSAKIYGKRSAERRKKKAEPC